MGQHGYQIKQDEYMVLEIILEVKQDNKMNLFLRIFSKYILIKKQLIYLLDFNMPYFLMVL